MSRILQANRRDTNSKITAPYNSGVQNDISECTTRRSLKEKTTPGSSPIYTDSSPWPACQERLFSGRPNPLLPHPQRGVCFYLQDMIVKRSEKRPSYNHVVPIID